MRLIVADWGAVRNGAKGFGTPSWGQTLDGRDQRHGAWVGGPCDARTMGCGVPYCGRAGCIRNRLLGDPARSLHSRE